MIKTNDGNEFKTNGDALDYIIKRMLESSPDRCETEILHLMEGDEQYQLAVLRVAAMIAYIFPDLFKGMVDAYNQLN